MSSVYAEYLPLSTRDEWRKAVLSGGPPCGNCGRGEQLLALPAVPFERGGQLVATNAIVLCRPCALRSGMGEGSASSGEQATLTFCVSTNLDTDLTRAVERSTSLRSVSALIRYLVRIYLQSPDAFDDLETYQDAPVGRARVKICVSCPRADHDDFVKLCEAANTSLTERIVALLLLYLVTSEKTS